MIAEKRYDDAISLLTDGQSLVSDPEKIQHKISEIRDNAPIKLLKLKITSSRFFDLQDSKSLVDTVGNSYPQEISLQHMQREILTTVMLRFTLEKNMLD